MTKVHKDVNVILKAGNVPDTNNVGVIQLPYDLELSGQELGHKVIRGSARVDNLKNQTKPNADFPSC